MGYFSQRKKRQRENMFLTASLAVICLILLVSFFDGSYPIVAAIDNYLFQIYIFNLFLFLFALFHQKILFSVVALLVLLVSYTNISSAANIFSNTKVEADNEFILTYHKQLPSPKAFADSLGFASSHYGHIQLTPNLGAVFATVSIKDNIFTIVQVDFAKLELAEEELLFKNLADYVLAQDEPVIIFGNFGVPSWSQYFKEFLHQTSLEVKNRIILEDLQHDFSLFNIPSVNLVAYNNVGLAGIETVAAAKDKPAAVKFEVIYAK